MRCSNGPCLWSLCLVLCLVGATTGLCESIYLVSKTGTPGTANAVAVANGLAYVADGTAGLKIYDVTEPSRPALKGTFAVNGQSVNYVTVNGTQAYISTNYNADAGGNFVPGGGTSILDVSNPASPRLLAELKTTKGMGDAACAVSGSRLFIAGDDLNNDFPGSFSMADITNPGAPVVKDQFPLGREAGRLKISGNFAAVAQDLSGVNIFDISSSSHMRMQGHYAAGIVSDVDFLGDAVIYGSKYYPDRAQVQYAGVQLLEINQSTLSPRGAYYTRNNINGLCVKDRLIFAANDVGGLLVLEAPTLDQIIERGSYDTAGHANGVATTDGKIIYVADGEGGLTILRYVSQAPTTTDQALLIRHTIPAAITAGQTVAVSATFANLSTTAWSEAAKYRLALLNKTCPLWATTWPRVAFPATTAVATNQEYTFIFNLKAPATPGSYPIQLEMVHEGVGFFGEQLSLTVQVNKPLAADPAGWKAYN